MKRRKFMLNTGLALAGAYSANIFGNEYLNQKNVFVSNRPIPKNRTFRSSSVDKLIQKLKNHIYCLNIHYRIYSQSKHQLMQAQY